MRKLLIFILFLSSCTSSVKLEPDILPNIVINQEYSVNIKIIGGKVIPWSFEYSISPKDSGLILKSAYPPEYSDFNNLILSGIPKHSGEIEIIITGSTYGDMFHSSNTFHKKYIIKVLEP